MSRRTLRVSVPVDDGSLDGTSMKLEIVSGWDRPLQRFHLTVYRGWGCETRDQLMLWDCLALRTPQEFDLAKLIAVVEGFVGSMRSPTDWFAQVYNDKVNDAGNESSVEYL